MLEGNGSSKARYLVVDCACWEVSPDQQPDHSICGRPYVCMIHLSLCSGLCMHDLLSVWSAAYGLTVIDGSAACTVDLESVHIV